MLKPWAFLREVKVVKVRDDVPRLANGRVDVAGWAADITAHHPQLDAQALTRAGEMVVASSARGEPHLESGVELAQLVAELGMDTATLVAAIAYRSVRTGAVAESEVEAKLGAEASQLVGAVVRMATTSLLEMTNTRLQTTEARDQVDNVRRMLVSLIDDPRVAVLKLAERIVALRLAKNTSDERRERIAREAHLIFAPLAGRLGIWQLKWELEDLALRYLEPDAYMAIAKQLDGRRAERESQIAGIVALLEAKLSEDGVDAQVIGRAKHIYSIFRKMHSKKVGMDEVYDVRAVRVLVKDIAQCYAALGVIHGQWQHIPSEFDDYIACPKENGYRSIHTAVMGPGGKTLEVQIRTTEMHEEAELGVCAHWSYKGSPEESASYSDKMNWLRQFVDWPEDTLPASFAKGVSDELAGNVPEERIFVYTPKGHVIDLTTGATPVDFAYRVHTEVGHRCTGAKVDGQPVRLNAPLATGQRVEIVTGKFEAPDRSWLDSRLGFVRTARAREKIQAWFRDRPEYENRAFGITIIADMMERLGVARPDTEALGSVAKQLGFAGEHELTNALAIGDCQVSDVVGVLHGSADQEQLSLLPQEEESNQQRFSLTIEARDRDGLLRDVTTLLSSAGVSILASTSRQDAQTGVAVISLDLLVADLRELALIIEQLNYVPDVVDARRIAG